MTFSPWSSLDERGGILTGKTQRHGGSGWGEERGSGGLRPRENAC